MKMTMLSRMFSVVFLFALFGLSKTALAEDPPPKNESETDKTPVDRDVEEILITADPYEQLGANVSKIPKEEIRKQGAKNAADILEKKSAFSANTGSRGERNFYLRGFDQRQTLVLIDGVPASIPYDGFVDLAMIPAEMIEQLTVIKGPGSVLYGPNGLGGAVNIVTRRPGQGPFASMEVEYGQMDAVSLKGFHTYSIGKFGYTFYGGMRSQSAFPLPSGFDPTPKEDGVLRTNSDRFTYNLGSNFTLRLPKNQELYAKVSYVDGSKAVPPSTVESLPNYWRFGVWRSIGASIGHKGQFWDRLDLDEVLFVRVFDNLLNSYDDATYTTQTSARAYNDWFHDQIFGGRIRARYWLDKTPWGYTFFRLWTSVQHDRHVDQEQGQEPQDPDSRTVITIAPEAEALFFQKLSLTVGFQLDTEIPGNFPTMDSKTQIGWGPLFSLRYEPINNLFLRGTVARRNRFPTLKERFSGRPGFRKPNPNLGPETAWHFSLEATWKILSWLTMDVAFFDAEVEGLIERVALGNSTDQFQNLGATRLLGFETSTAVKPLSWLRLAIGYSFLHARKIDVDPPEDQLTYRPKHKATFEMSIKPLKWIEFSTWLRLIGPQTYQDPNTAEYAEMDPHLVWDARMEFFPLDNWSIWLRATNILDWSYETKIGFPDPGRQIWAGMRIRVH